MAAARRSAVIAGAGIGGLATAIALARRGIDAHVCERRAEFPEEGAGIQIGPNGMRILRQLNVAELLEDQAARPAALIVHDGASGRERARLPLGQWIAERHSAPYWTAHRRDLHIALRKCAEKEPRITLSRDTEIVTFTDEPDGITAVDAKGGMLRASFLVAADGLWSTLRASISGSPTSPRPVGKTAFRSVTAAQSLPRGLDGNAAHIWLSRGTHVVHYPVNAGSKIALVVIADDATSHADWDAPATATTANDKIKSFAAPLRTLVESARLWRQWSLYRMAPLPRWTNGRAALLGDAAHPMLPFLAQGAVMALEDALTLAAHVSASKDDIGSALCSYEQARRPRIAKVAEASERNGRIYHMSGPAAFARDTVMRMRSPESIMADFDWLYGWSVKSS